MKKIWLCNLSCLGWNSKPASNLTNLHFQKYSLILRTWPVSQKCLDWCHVFQNAKFCIQRQILFFTRDMSMHKNQFSLKIHQFCILSFHFSLENRTEKHFSMQKIYDYPPQIPYLKRNLWIHKIKKIVINQFDLSNCILVCTVTYVKAH